MSNDIKISMSFRVAIVTKFIGPTNTRGSRVKAIRTQGKESVTLHWNDALNSDENHMRAARALMVKMGWTGEVVGGALDKGYAFVFEI